MNFSSISNNNVVGRLLRQPLRLIPDRTPMLILQGRLRGKRWLAGSHTHGCWLGSYENEKQKLFESAVKEGDVVFDIGANVGFYTMLASVLVGPSGRVHAFEPVPRNIRFLNDHLRLNRMSNVEVIEAAVSDESGETCLDDSPGSAMGYVSAVGTLKVKAVAIDDLVAQGAIAPPDCVKIDVEGGEVLVLSGAKSVLEKCHPKIFLATHGPEVHRQSCDFLQSLGYQLEAIGSRTVRETDELIAYCH